MEFKGTKGNWIVDEYTNVSVDYNEIAFLKSSTPNMERRANALLISKAPEMLEMLIHVKDYLGSDQREKVEELIQSATTI